MPCLSTARAPAAPAEARVTRDLVGAPTPFRDDLHFLSPSLLFLKLESTNSVGTRLTPGQPPCDSRLLTGTGPTPAPAPRVPRTTFPAPSQSLSLPSVRTERLRNTVPFEKEEERVRPKEESSLCSALVVVSGVGWGAHGKEDVAGRVSQDGPLPRPSPPVKAERVSFI